MRRTGVAAALLSLVGTASCCSCVTTPTFTVREGAALAPPPRPARAAPSVRALHYGDFGDRTCQQAAVASGIETSHRLAPFDLGFESGDLIYDCGPDATLPGANACAFGPDGAAVAAGFSPPPDPSFEVHDGPLSFLGQTPVYVALGNHDVAATGGCAGPMDPIALGRLKACLEVAHAAPQWVMPARHYAVDRGPARFVVIDSNVVGGDYGGFTLEDEIAFVAAQAEGCADRLCFLVGHRPPATAGDHGSDPAVAARFERLLAATGGRFRAYLAGHDHDLQHVRMANGLDVFVSGNGARGRWRERFAATAPAGTTLLFASVRWGHGVLEAHSDGWDYRFEDDEARPLYCCAASGAGRCEPVSCR